MVSPFEAIVKKLIELGVYDYLLPFIITLALVYGFLRKSKILGGSVALDATVALAFSFFIFGFSYILGMSLAMPMTTFFTQASIFMIIFILGFIIASLFYPNLAEWLPTVFVRRTTLGILIALMLGIFVISGLISVMWVPLIAPPVPEAPPRPPRDLLILAAGIIIFVIFLIAAAGMVR